MIMFDMKSYSKVLRWINQVNVRNRRDLTVPSTAAPSVDLPEIIDEVPFETLISAFYDMLKDEFRRAGKIVMDLRRDILNWSEKPGEPTVPLFESCPGKTTIDKHVWGIYDLVREINAFYLVILQAVSRHLPYLSARGDVKEESPTGSSYPTP